MCMWIYIYTYIVVCFSEHALHQKGVGPLVSSRGLRVEVVPGHALHEKGLQRHNGVGPLVSSQEERALAVLLINRG